MRLTCPLCGDRDQREFACTGSAVALSRPAEGASAEEWDDYLHNRDNPAGLSRELWYHNPCGAWIVVERDTATHEILSTTLASEAAR